MGKDIGKSITSLKNELDKLANQVQKSKGKSEQHTAEFHSLLANHIESLAFQLQHEQIPKPGSSEFEEWKKNNNQLLGWYPPILDQIGKEVKEIITYARNAANYAQNAANDAKETASALVNGLENTTQEAVGYGVSQLGVLLGEAVADVKKVESLVDATVLQTLQIAGKVPGSIKSLEPVIKNAEGTIRNKIQKEINDKDSPLHNLLEILYVVHQLSELGKDLVERIEIVIHSLEDLAEKPLEPVIKILKSIQDLFKGKREEIPDKLLELLVLIIVTTNPIAAAIEALFAGKNKSLGDLLTPGLPTTGTLYKWMTEVSEPKKSGKPFTPQRKERELAFRRMVVGAVDSYIRTGHTGSLNRQKGQAEAVKDSVMNGIDLPGGTIRAVDLRPLVASGVELASVLSGALLSYLFMPSGVPNPAVPKLPHRMPTMPHPYDFRGDMAASFARTVTQPVMSIAAVVLNGFWEISPNNRALVDAVSGYLGHLIRSLFEHLLSGILHLFEVHEVYPDEKNKDGYIALKDWPSWNTIHDHKTKLQFRVYLDLHVAYHLIDKNNDIHQELKNLETSLNDLIDKKVSSDSVLLGLLKDYVGYREAVMDYRNPRSDAAIDSITEFKTTQLDKDTIQLTVKLDSNTINGPSIPVVKVFSGDAAPLILNPEKENTYSGKLKLPPLSKLTKRLQVHALSNYGGMKSAEINLNK